MENQGDSRVRVALESLFYRGAYSLLLPLVIKEDVKRERGLKDAATKRALQGDVSRYPAELLRALMGRSP